ncbi:hypothetical protein [Lacticaseibacillus nasuensis]|uniref:Uncharacterized protein n=2 Tax=Lacticaseibacillus TaxID=2759736 RepID=A0A0R1JPC1_9LACO|nr:hypothetical protein [Lacticaseibacillus nasuensis]KRK70196.1 hypothetical protein FD02_GL000652 [Lacticaseibacillus nasuensis JCM 17158]
MEMYHAYPCYDCQNEGYVSQLKASVTEKSYLSATCQRWHHVDIFTSTPLFAPLYEHAMQAHISHNYFESFLSAYSALENIFRIASQANIWMYSNRDMTAVDKALKFGALLSSERCQGNFYTVAAERFPKRFETITEEFNRLVSVRNKVMHGSVIPDEGRSMQALMTVWKVGVICLYGWMENGGSVIQYYQMTRSNYDLSKRSEHVSAQKEIEAMPHPYPMKIGNLCYYLSPLSEVRGLLGSINWDHKFEDANGQPDFEVVLDSQLKVTFEQLIQQTPPLDTIIKKSIKR